MSRYGKKKNANLGLEMLEAREVPTITNHGGIVLPHVEVQAMYYGSDWSTNAYFGQKNSLDNFLGMYVNSSAMDMLTNDGYGVGRGSATPGAIYGVNVNKAYYLTDSQIQSDLVGCINAGALQRPDANRLYVIFVEDNVAISTSFGNSQNNFLAYHGAFGAWTVDPSSWLGISYNDIHYAVVAYPGGSVGNAGRWWLNAFDTMTLSASHEITEAITDPNINYKTWTWYDDNLNGENGDVDNAQTVYLNGYAVQRIPDLNDQAMTPRGATSQRQVNFILKNDGTLWESTGGSPFQLSSGIASLSDQSIDTFGRAVVDVVTTGGAAYEYHDGLGWTYLTSGVKSAKAGQGVSYVLYNSGTVYEYKDWGQGAQGNGATWTYIDSNVTSIDAGTDRYGVNMETEVWYGGAWEHSDSTGWHYIAGGVQSISAGQWGIMDYLTTGGNAYWFNEASGSSSFLGSGVAAVTAGTDQYGNYLIDMLYTNSNLYEYRVGSGWSYLDNNVTSVGKGHNGVVDMVFSWGDAYDHTSGGWFYLTSNAKTAA
jgi:hypothetical protein